jgi:iron(III) transport system ATP-binding protein
VVSLLGPSGCGKTTTLRCIAGFYQPDGGSITINDRLIASTEMFLPPEERNLAMVFQNYVLWPHMTAFDNVAYGLRLRGVDKNEIRRRVRDVMAILGLAGLEGRYPHALSGGQQQRLSVARSLVVEPQVLLLDEPFSNLDAKLRVEMRREMRDLLKRLNTTAIYVTHDQEEAMALSDRIILMQDGRIVQSGTPLNLFERPASRFAAEFFGISNFLPGTVTKSQQGLSFRADQVEIEVPLSAEAAEPGTGRRLLGVREDGVVVSPSEQRGPGWVQGQLSSRMYLGGFVQCVVSCGEVNLHARVNGSAALAWPQDLSVRLDTAHAVLLPAGDGGPSE